MKTMETATAVGCAILSLLLPFGTNGQNLTADEELSEQQANAHHFWVLSEITHFHWKPDCVSGQLCSEPRLTLSNQMPRFNERVAQDWPLTMALVRQHSSAKLFSFWQRGLPTDISVQASLQGTDPKFRFARLCDETASVFVFQTTTVPVARQQIPSSNGNMEGEHQPSSVQLELHALCFNATLKVQLFQGRCPWCAVPIADPIEAQQIAEQMPSLQLRQHLLVLLLTVATAVNVAAFLGLLFLCLRQCRAEKRELAPKRVQQSSSPKNSRQSATDAADFGPNFRHFYCIGPDLDFSPPRELAPQMPPSALPHHMRSAYRRLPQPPEMDSTGLLPAIVEEHYEVIGEGNSNAEMAPPAWHPVPLQHRQTRYGGGSGSTEAKLRENATSKKVRLPMFNRCHHCFLRFHQRQTVGSSFAIGSSVEEEEDDRCSCASLELPPHFSDHHHHNLQQLVAGNPSNTSSSSSSSSASTSFCSSTSTNGHSSSPDANELLMDSGLESSSVSP